MGSWPHTIVSEEASLSSRQYSFRHFLHCRMKSSLQLIHVWPQPKQSRRTPTICVHSRQPVSIQKIEHIPWRASARFSRCCYPIEGLQGQSLRLVSGIQLPHNGLRVEPSSRAPRQNQSSPHSVSSSARHPFIHEAVFYAKAHMYLDGLLWDHLGCPVGLKRLHEFSLL